MSSNRTLVMMLDADNHVYNYLYRGLVIHIVLRFGAAIKQNHTNDVSSNWDLIWSIQNFIKNTSRESLRVFLNDLEPPFFAYDEDPIVMFKKAIENTCSEFIVYLNKLDSTIMEKIFLRANESLTNIIKEKKFQYKDVILMSGSNRCSLHGDLTGALTNGTRLFCTDLHFYANHLQVKLDRFLLVDVLSDLDIGESYARILEEDFSFLATIKKTKLDHEHNENLDRNKMTFIMAASNYIKKTYGDNVHVEFYDDLDEIINALARVFHHDHASVLLPAGLSIDLIHYIDKTQSYNKPIRITGNGRFEENYMNNIKKLIAIAPKQPPFNGIDPANEVDLKAFIASTYSAAATNDVDLSGYRACSMM